MDLYERIMELGSMGYHCSQIIMIMTLETIGEENPQLVKAMGGLGGGIGYCGDTCGCLTGSACAIGYFLGNLAEICGFKPFWWQKSRIFFVAMT